MKKIILGATLLAATLLGLGACGQHSRVDELKKFVEKVQKEGSGYTEEKWQKANDEFSKLLDQLNSYEDLSPEEVKEIAKYQAEYATAAFKQHAGQFMEQADKMLEKAGAALEGTLEGLTGDDDTKESDD